MLLLLPLPTIFSTWKTSSYTSRMSRTSTHWYISLEFLVPISAWHLGQLGRLIVNRGKLKSISGISLPKSQIDDIDKSYKFLGILQSFSYNDKELRYKAASEYKNRVRQVGRSKLSSKNKVTAINTFAVPFIRYPAAVVSWKKEDLKEIDIGTRNLMTMHGVFHPKSSTAKL